VEVKRIEVKDRKQKNLISSAPCILEIDLNALGDVNSQIMLARRLEKHPKEAKPELIGRYRAPNERCFYAFVALRKPKVREKELDAAVAQLREEIQEQLKIDQEIQDGGGYFVQHSGQGPAILGGYKGGYEPEPCQCDECRAADGE